MTSTRVECELCENFFPSGKCESEGDRKKESGGKKKKKGKKVPEPGEADGGGW